MLPTSRLLLRGSAALLLLLLLTLTWTSPKETEARMMPPSWNYDLRAKMHRAWESREDPAALREKLEAFAREGRFPKFGRSLETKIREASAFMEQQLGDPSVSGVGVSAAIVYKDKVVLSRGYGLRDASDNTSSVTSSTLFQIGSVTKTFITLGIATLVDEGKVAWRDPVIKHLPTLQLFDKYAEKHVTIGDLLAMNSGLGELLDLSLAFGKYLTDKELVDALHLAEPAHSLRSEYEYSNSNFAILGQLIESVSGLEWDVFLKQRIWDPLGMTRTFGSALEVKDDKDVSSGHFSCGGEVLGPFNLASSPEAQLITGGTGEKMAAGSVVSSSDDMAKLLRVLLNKGTVDGVTILRSPSLVSDMVSGKSIVNAEMTEMFTKGGHQLVREGNTLAAGYGFDFVSPAMWGHAYYDKSGDTAVHQTRTGLVPDDEKLGVIIMANSQLPGPHVNYIIDHVRSYVLGIFLDVPKDILDASFAQWRKDDALKPVLPGAPVCGTSFWKNAPDLKLDPAEAQAIAGVYLAQVSPDFYGPIEIVKTSENRLEVRAEKLVAKLQLVVNLDEGQSKIFLFGMGATSGVVQIDKSQTDDGKHELNLGVVFKQQ